MRFEWNFNAREFLSLEEPSVNNADSYFGCGLYWGVTWRTVLKFSSSLSDYQKLFRKSEKIFQCKAIMLTEQAKHTDFGHWHSY